MVLLHLLALSEARYLASDLWAVPVPGIPPQEFAFLRYTTLQLALSVHTHEDGTDATAAWPNAFQIVRWQHQHLEVLKHNDAQSRSFQVSHYQFRDKTQFAGFENPAVPPAHARQVI